jgi:hypothetical protein
MLVVVVIYIEAQLLLLLGLWTCFFFIIIIIYLFGWPKRDVFFLLRDERKRNKVDGFVGIRLGPYFSLRSSKIRRRGKKKK